MLRSKKLLKIQTLLLIPIFIYAWAILVFSINHQDEFSTLSKTTICKVKTVASSIVVTKKTNESIYNATLTKPDDLTNFPVLCTAVKVSYNYYKSQHLLIFSNKSPPVKA